MHHFENLVIIGCIIHRKLLCHFILPSHFLINQPLILLLIISTLVPLVARSAAPVLWLVSLGHGPLLEGRGVRCCVLEHGLHLLGVLLRVLRDLIFWCVALLLKCLIVIH